MDNDATNLTKEEFFFDCIDEAKDGASMEFFNVDELDKYIRDNAL